MPGLADTLRHLRALQSPAAGGEAAGGSQRLRPMTSFGSNPGALAAWYYVPERSSAMALVVVLHGCTQNARGYDHGAGWSELAERFGFALLFPEQQRINNPNLCFNWFQDEDNKRDRGEAMSISQMIAAMRARHPIAHDRIYVTGLSAGGAMANVMLATYPDLFAGGSVIAGLPYGTARSVAQALERMRGSGHPTIAQSGDAVRAAAPRDGQWPTVTVWHGDADHTVVVGNADAIVDQWRAVHSVGADAPRVERSAGLEHRSWVGRDGRTVVEEYRIAGLGHGTPLKTHGPESCGNAGAYMLEAGISSTWVQARQWGLLDEAFGGAIEPSAAPERARDTASPERASLVTGVAATIEQALRSAGLMH